ncbi:TIGR03086 family protein [Spiractinospora alimapuensis]|uniref:TIGR03086 family metal-binding protein n=1 Tax=Spiractinospora alimapuensis TaxID=2820884 RepID=UPI001F1DE05C|nr:TIGR03086 family metal-binding protein [Spiractinospora alimapuensis]QVQ50648.1 TIGR03086 family protein [Spiractinospora alimapuensis]
MIDIEPAARRMRNLAAGVPDDELAAPTPCAEMRVGDLLDHVLTLAWAFRLAAEKETTAADGPPPVPKAENLPSDWRTRLDHRLGALVEAWSDPTAWEGETAVGGVAAPGEEVGMIALDELVLHGWDLARATGQEYVCPQDDAEACYAFVSAVPPDDPAAREGLFGPVVPVPQDAPLFDRVLGLSGRDPKWTPPASG